jgi:CRISPR-associated endonuclease Csn1
MEARKLRYRLALDLGTTSIGWAMFRLNPADEPIAIIRAGVRIFGDGRNPQDGSSLAVTRREARAMRRNRDRKLKRRARLMSALIDLGFFPRDEAARKALDNFDPYELRAKGLDQRLRPEEFARAIFHLNQRRGFKSNRKTDKADNESGALKGAIKRMREGLAAENLRTVGEWLFKRHSERRPVRARYRETRVQREDGKTRILKSYDLYIDRAMVEREFDLLWAKQAEYDPARFVEAARLQLKGILFHQRPLRPVKPGRCTLIPDEERAPLALPTVQQFRVYQELNNLAILTSDAREQFLNLEQRNTLAKALNESSKRTFTQIARALKLGGSVKFNLEDSKRDHLKGNMTAAVLADDKRFGGSWHDFPLERQDEIVTALLQEEDESALIRWLMLEFGFDEERADRIANAPLPDGYGNLSRLALSKVLPELKRTVVTYDKAVVAAGFASHSALSHGEQTGEVLLAELPYYGEPLQRHVGFGTGDPNDPPEKRFGRIANPTVHIGLNQLRKVVNALIKRYGNPSEIIVEVTRELKQSRERRIEIQREQAVRQVQNEKWKVELQPLLGREATANDLQRMKLWVELNIKDATDRRCPYTGEQISLTRLFSNEVEIEHILPFSRTLDDSLNNKTVALRQANRDKGNRTPFDAFGQSTAGYDYAAILARASNMPKDKAKRFAADGYERWLREDKDFLARALTDTAYLSRVAREYLSLATAPNKVRAIPGRLTALLRGKFGLNDVLGLRGEKNRNDHRHHAVDACVIGVTDQGLLQRFANASASSRDQQLNKLVETMPDPFPNYRNHVSRAVSSVLVSHRPDHNHEGQMHKDTAYGLLGEGLVRYTKVIDGRRVREPERLAVIEFAEPKAASRHGLLPDGSPRPYKGYKGDSNYCIEIVRNEKGKWEGQVITTFEAYQIVRRIGLTGLRNPRVGASGRPLVMRISKGDCLKIHIDGRSAVFAVAWVRADGRIALYECHEANVDARDRDKNDAFAYLVKNPGPLQKLLARRVTVSPIGDLRDQGFRE